MQSQLALGVSGRDTSRKGCLACGEVCEGLAKDNSSLHSSKVNLLRYSTVNDTLLYLNLHYSILICTTLHYFIQLCST